MTPQPQVPTMYFLGVSTGESSSLKMFPAWAEILGLGDAQLVGVDLPLDSATEEYRAVIADIRFQPLLRGALITSHKIHVLEETRDLFDTLSADAQLCREISCVYKREERLIGHAVDPVTAGRAMHHFLGDEYWRTHRTEVLCLGAGGAATAILAHLLAHHDADNQPRCVTLVDVDEAQLDRIRALLVRLPECNVQVRLVNNADPAVNDTLLAELPPHALVINATGMGKDRPGSPITDAARFPDHAIVWEINYRGERQFLQQAQAHAIRQPLQVVDGWHYFLVGWAAVMEYIFDVSITEAQFDRLARAAESVRGE